MLGNDGSNEESASVDITEDAEAKNARQMLEYLDVQVENGKSTGVNFSDVEDMLTTARVMLESGEHQDAIDLINQCMQLASTRFSDHRVLSIAIRKAEKEIQAAHSSGKDVAESARLLRMARLHMEKGDYRLAINSAKHAQDALTKKPDEVVWGSGLQNEADSA